MDGPRDREFFASTPLLSPPSPARSCRVLRHDDAALCGMREGNIVPTHRPSTLIAAAMRCDVGAINKHLGNY